MFQVCLRQATKVESKNSVILASVHLDVEMFR